MWNRILVTALALLFIAVACTHQDKPAKAKTKRTAGPPAVSSTITLPNADGHVYIVTMPQGYGDDTRCLVLVTPTAGQVHCLAEDDPPLPSIEP